MNGVSGLIFALNQGLDLLHGFHLPICGLVEVEGGLDYAPDVFGLHFFVGCLRVNHRRVHACMTKKFAHILNRHSGINSNRRRRVPNDVRRHLASQSGSFCYLSNDGFKCLFTNDLIRRTLRENQVVACVAARFQVCAKGKRGPCVEETFPVFPTFDINSKINIHRKISGSARKLHDGSTQFIDRRHQVLFIAGLQRR